VQFNTRNELEEIAKKYSVESPETTK